MNTLNNRGNAQEMSAEERVAMIQKKHEGRILATATGLGFENYDKVDAETEELRNYFRLMPDFQKEVSEYGGKSEIYGEFKARVFKSKNDELKWTVMEDDQGRAWIGQIETKAPITSTGCRAQWVAGGDLATPLYEYASQDEGFGDYGDRRGNYVSMWKNYLSKMPVIREYKASKAEKWA